jgi:hypothetical protein
MTSDLWSEEESVVPAATVVEVPEIWQSPPPIQWLPPITAADYDSQFDIGATYPLTEARPPGEYRAAITSTLDPASSQYREDSCEPVSDKKPWLRIVITKEQLREVSPPARPLQVHIKPSGESERTSGRAIASLAFGLIGIFLIGLLVGPFAIILGAMALNQIRNDEFLQGRNLAVSGIVIGIVDIFLWIGLLFFYIARGITPPSVPLPHNVTAFASA